MKLSLQNIGIIEEANINIEGITLIAGKNDSGKSTVGKVLYAIIKGFNQDINLFQEEKNRTISYYYQEILRDLKKGSYDISKYQTKDINKEWILKIEELVKKNNTSDEIKNSIRDSFEYLRENFEKEYNTIEQKEDEIDLWINSEMTTLENVFINTKKETKIEIEDLLGSAKIQERFKSSIPTEKIFTKLDNNLELYFKEVFYIESPLVINESLQNFVGKENIQNYQRNRQDELSKSLSNPIQIKPIDFSKVYENISEVIQGEIIIDLLEGVRFKKNNKDIEIKNTAVGIKSFGIIQLLLKNNRLNNRSLLIIDEPEVHLHPTWQVKYAEILIILSKNLQVPIVLTSHSPYFIEAIEEFSKKYKYQKSTNFYFAEKNEEGLSSKIIDVTSDITPILDSISDAFYKIQDINYED